MSMQMCYDDSVQKWTQAKSAVSEAAQTASRKRLFLLPETTKEAFP